jgi:hypothetical protein
MPDPRRYHAHCLPGIASICLHLHRVDQVRELDRVLDELDEEDWDIVAHQIPIALLGIEFDREAAHIASAFVMPVSDSYSSK